MVDAGRKQTVQTVAAAGVDEAAQLPPAAEPPPPPDNSERHSLLPRHYADNGSRAHSPWHALEIQSSEDGSGHYPGSKVADALRAVDEAVVGPAVPTDPTELLLPSSAAASVAPPGGITARQRVYMVTLFSLVAALLYADQNLMAPNLSVIAADFGFDDQQRDRMLGGAIAAAFYLVGEQAGQADMFGDCDSW